MWDVPKTSSTIPKICSAKWQDYQNLFGFPNIYSALPKICLTLSSSSLFNDKMFEVFQKLVRLFPKSVRQNDKVPKICSAFPRFVWLFPRFVHLFLHLVCLMTRCVRCSKNLFDYFQNLSGKMTRFQKYVWLSQDLFGSSRDLFNFLFI